MPVVPMVVDSRVRVDEASLGEEASASLRSAFERDNPKHFAMKRIGKGAWTQPRRLVAWRREGWALTFPRGGMPAVRAVLARHGLQWAAEDRRTLGAESMRGAIGAHKVELRPYQRDAVEAASRVEQCILRLATGSGKTSVCLALAARLQLPTLVVVPNLGLMDQWLRRVGPELGMRSGDVGVIGRGRFEVRPLTVACVKTLASKASAARVAGVANAFGLVVFDEVHQAAARTFGSSIEPFAARYRVGVSDDHRRKDGLAFLVHDCFGAVAYDKPYAELVAEGWILDVDVHVVPTEFRADWYGLSREPEPGEDPGPAREVDIARLYSEMGADAVRCRLVLDWCARWAREGQLLAMGHRREQCEALAAQLSRSGVEARVVMGAQGAAEADEYAASLADFGAGRLRAVVGTYQAIGTGIDLPAIAQAACMTPIAGNEQVFRQVRGRVCRPGKGKRARLLYFWDRFVFPDHLRNIARWSGDAVRVWDGSGWVDAREHLRRAA